MRKVLFAVFFFLLLIGCSNSKQDKTKSSEEMKTCVIDVDKVDEFVDISDLFENDIIISKLETNDSCLISDILKVQIEGKFIYISDQTAQCVFQFNESGKFVKSIGRRGEGPDEYASIGDFVANDKYIYIQDLYANKILRYDVQDTSSTAYPIETGTYADELIDFDGFLYLVSNYKKTEKGYFNLFRMDLATKQTEVLLPADKEITDKHSAWGLNRFASKYGNSALLTYPLNDTIYRVTKESVSPQYIVRFSSRTLPVELRHKSAMEIMENSSKYILGMDRIRNSKKYIFFDYGDNGFQKSAMVNKETLAYQAAERFICKRWGDLYMTSPEVAQDELVIFQPAYFFRRTWDAIYSKRKFEDSECRKQFQSVYDAVKEDDNPILFRLKFKK